MKWGGACLITGQAVLVLGIWVIVEFPGTGVGGALLGLAYALGVYSGTLMEGGK